MKTRTLIQFLALLALGLGAFAQNENEEPPAPADPPETPAPGTPAPAPEPETPEPAPEPETPVPAPEPEPATPAEPPAPDAPAPEPATPPAPAPQPATPPVTPPAPAADALAAPPNVAAPPAEAEKSESGLAWIVLQPGTGTEKPGPTDRVEVHYTGWKCSDGERFDSSVQRGSPSSFGLNQVIKGWTEGLQLMVEGEKRRFWIPADLAYGEEPAPGKPGGMLCFDVELLGILRPPPTPEHLTSAPPDAEVTPSGLATKVLEPGTGTVNPGPRDNVRVHYTFWTTDGEMGDSSLKMGNPSTFPLYRTIPGFTEALQMMVEGEKRRMWIPTDLAYGADAPENAPKGMLIFEVELLKIFPGSPAGPRPQPPTPGTP